MDNLIFKERTSHLKAFAQSLDQRTVTFLKVILASCFIGLCAQIKIPLYFTPVPLTTQTFAVMLVGALLGGRHAAMAILCYLMQGCLGLPVWAGGAAGFAHLMGPTGGYRIAYFLQAFIIGKWVERQQDLKLNKFLAVLAFSICVQMGIGSLWLAPFVGLNNCFMLGFYPFILGESAKALIVAGCVKTFRKKSTIGFKKVSDDFSMR